MASAGDIIQIRVTSVYQLQEMVAVFAYEVLNAGTAPSVEDCLSEFKDTVWDAVRAAQVPRVITTGFTAINGMDNSEFEIEAVGSVGNSDITSGSDLPPIVSAALRSGSGGPGTRYTYHWVSGFKSGALDGEGGHWTATMQFKLNTIALAMGANLEGAVGIYAPVQIPSFVLGVIPTVNRNLQGTWVYNTYPASRRSRMNYEWEAAAP